MLELRSAEFHHRLNALRSLDNWTNWLYLAREYFFLIVTVALTITFYACREAWGIGWVWNVPVTAVAVTLIGAGQHRLATLGHEACHYLLFRNRLLNELVSDWFCMFPLLTGTHLYRITHLAHHQFVNDAERDPDLKQLEASGHGFEFPMSRRRFLWHCLLKQLLIPGLLLRYLFVRALYNALGAGTSTLEATGRRSRWLAGIVLAYLAGLICTMVMLTLRGDPWLVALVGLGLVFGIAGLLAAAPRNWFRQTGLKPDVPSRWTAIGRLVHLSLVIVGIAELTCVTGLPWALYYFVLWLLPIATTFSLFMMLRQVVQHANAGDDRWTSSRIFHTGLLGLAVFPIGMDYHLPHHLFPLVPHYNLRRLHALLMATEEYRIHAMIVEGYFLPRPWRPGQRTVLDVVSDDPPGRTAAVTRRLAPSSPPACRL